MNINDIARLATETAEELGEHAQGLGRVEMQHLLRRATTLRDLRHYVRRMLRVEGIAQRPLRAMSTKECRALLEKAFGNSEHSFNKGRAILHSIFPTGGGRVIPLRRRQRLSDMQLSIPRNWQKRWQALRRAAGFTHWQPDVCRHTFASYHAAYFKDLGALQLEMGHRSTELLRPRYLNLPEVHQTRAFWG